MDNDLLKGMTDALDAFRITPTNPQQPHPSESTDEWRERNSPLIDRVRALLKKIPPDVIAEGLELHTLRVRLKGKSSITCHPGELGACLRELGYVRKRYWADRGRGEFCARWFKDPNHISN